MPRKNSYLTVTDQFCGAGGTGQGAKKAGFEIKQALNHWKLATETYNTNFPNTLVDCTDISACDPRRYYSTDVLCTSPECTTHTPAGGNRHKQVKQQLSLYETGKIDPATERSRATMWDVCRFAEYHQYRYIVVENVVEAKTRWQLFENWLTAMHTLGYYHRCIYHNSMHHHPTPQSRDRMYVVFWKKNLKAPNLDYTPLAYCPACEKNVNAVQTWKRPDVHYGKYRQQYIYCCPVHAKPVEPYYYAAFNCIDWSNIGTKIGDRQELGKKPLSQNTVKRINFGLDKYGDEIFLIDDKQSTGIDFRVRSTSNVVNTIHTDPRVKMITPPIIVNTEHTSQDGTSMVRSSTEPVQTQLTRQTMGLLTPFIVDGNYDAKPSRASSILNELPTSTTQPRTGVLMQPYIIEMNNTGECKPAGNATSTVTAGGINHAVLNAPIIIENKGTSTARGITEPLATQTQKSYLGLISDEAWKSFIHYNYSSTTLSKIVDPLGACNTHDRHSLITYQKPKIEDCYYRMLFPREVHKAMAFGSDYVVLGSGKDQVKQLGNAVNPPVMEWIMSQIRECLN